MTRAEKEAARLLTRFSIDQDKVPVCKLAEALGAEIEYEDLRRMAGMLIRKDNRAFIVVNENDPDSRKRFTIAHEIAHLQLHKGELFLDHNYRVNFREGENSRTASRQQEREANAFAAELLMPCDRVIEAYVEITRGSPNIDIEDLVMDLADRFGVSRMAMSYRLANIGLTSLP
jgi:Zn-dependent peptidase ImmA (M78 family)